MEYERISQHVSNIRAINFKGKPVPEGIKTYLAKQIEFIRGMVGRRFSVRLTASESSQGRGVVLEARWFDDDAAGGSGGWVSAVCWTDVQLQRCCSFRRGDFLPGHVHAQR